VLGVSSLSAICLPQFLGFKMSHTMVLDLEIPAQY